MRIPQEYKRNLYACILLASWLFLWIHIWIFFFFFFRKCLSKKISILVRLSAQLERLGENVQ